MGCVYVEHYGRSGDSDRVLYMDTLVRVRERYDRSGDGVYIECYGRSG